MGRKKMAEEVAAGEQMQLLDVGAKNTKEIIKHARALKVARTQRLAAGVIETTEEQELLSLVRDSGLKRLSNGNIEFECDGVEIKIIPRDELVKVKDKQEE